MTTNPIDPLQFAAPEETSPQAWAAADKASFAFAKRFLDQARELNDYRRQAQQAWAERDRVVGFVVRNLITLAENCKAALAQAPPEAEAPALEQTALASVQRGVLHLLEELGVLRVELLGSTYDTVQFDGTPIDDPFVVEESERQGKTSEMVVREVVTDLWVRRSDGHVEILQRGRVRC